MICIWSDLTFALDFSAELVVFRPSSWQTKPDVSCFHLGYIAHCMWSLPHVKSVKHGITRAYLQSAFCASCARARTCRFVQLSVAHPMLFQRTLFRLKLQGTPEAEGTKDPL